MEVNNVQYFWTEPGHFLGIQQLTFWELMCLAQRHITVEIDLSQTDLCSEVKRSTTRPLRSPT